MSDKLLMTLESWRNEDDISIGESMSKVELIIASIDKVEVEAFDCWGAESADKAGVWGMIDLLAEFLIFIDNFGPDCCDITHL